jgi:hypothetical protein
MTEKKKKIQNPDLFKCLGDLVKAFVEGLDKPFFPSYGSWYDRVRTLIKGDTELVARILEKRPDLEEEKLSSCLVSADRCLKTLLEEDIYRNPPHAHTKDEYRDELAFFLEKLLKKRERMRARAVFATIEALNRHFERVFLEEYLEYENYLYQEAVSDFLNCEFHNLTCSKSVELESYISIRKVTQKEFHSLVEADERYGYRLESYPEFVLYVCVENENWRRQLIRLVTALRLLKKERIGLKRIYYAFALPCRPWKVIEAPTETKITEGPMGSSFTLSENDEEELKHLWGLLDQVEEVGYLTISIRRFNSAYEREKPEDRWIDYFISLESLYSKANELTEVTHRLATRVSRALINGTLEDRKRLRQKIKRWYTVRSKIVHGTQTNVNPEQLQDLEEVLRKSLKWFMSHRDYNNHNKIVDLLDLGS